MGAGGNYTILRFLFCILCVCTSTGVFYWYDLLESIMFCFLIFRFVIIKVLGNLPVEQAKDAVCFLQRCGVSLVSSYAVCFLQRGGVSLASSAIIYNIVKVKVTR